jgi:hypothetical protein
MPWTIEADGSYKYLAGVKEAEAVAPCLLFATLIGAARKSAVPVTAFKDALKPALKSGDQIDRDPLR